jgi:hypothetical protein
VIEEAETAGEAEAATEEGEREETAEIEKEEGR